MRTIIRLGWTAVLLSAFGCAWAATPTPVGTWTTFDDATGQAKAIVEMVRNNGELEGTVIKVLQSDQGPNPVCKECTGDRHNQPVTGMKIVWGLKADGDQWDGGHILDPHNGKVYRCSMKPDDAGQKLEVRGYIGLPLLGRTQVWQRHSAAP